MSAWALAASKEDRSTTEEDMVTRSREGQVVEGRVWVPMPPGRNSSCVRMRDSMRS